MNEPARFVDLQVNGYAGVDFNQTSYDAESLQELATRLKTDGVRSFLPTIITAPLATMVSRIQHLIARLDECPTLNQMVAGIHLEGPFLLPEPGYIGAHPVDATLPATIDTMSRLLDAGHGRVRLVTLAPEVDHRYTVTHWLSNQSITVSAGHSNATTDQLKGAIDNGLRMYTHLGNGCPSVMHRHDNIIQRVLSLAEHIRISWIADGHHVPPFALRNYLSIVPNDHIIIVTDAISAAGRGPGSYSLGDQVVHVDDRGAAWSEDRTHFAGSAATMPQMVQVLRSMGYSLEQIDCWTSRNPAKVIEAS